ncbi:asparaginase [Streptosporangium violaceochromogenes]|nr:asparaginase [Streptosporangium violaceochromogenes]
MSGEVLTVEVVRSGFVESVHRARLLAVDAGGSPVRVHGAVDALVSPRSAVKPLQALGMIRAGLPLRDELLALSCASHLGEPFHLDGVRKILGEAGLGEDALRCPEDLPGDPASRDEVLRSGGGPARIFMNCSGKHAAMLATCAVNDWPLETYLDPAHPLQRAIRDTVSELSGELIAATGVDGCGAPLFFVSTVGVTRAFRALVQVAPGTPERQVADAFRTHPEWTSGTTRPEVRLMRALPGLMVKTGAEAFAAFAFADGRAGAVKIEDGGGRAQIPVVVTALRALGFEAPELDELATGVLLGGGRPVGEIRVR